MPPRHHHGTQLALTQNHRDQSVPSHVREYGIRGGSAVIRPILFILTTITFLVATIPLIYHVLWESTASKTHQLETAFVLVWLSFFTLTVLLSLVQFPQHTQSLVIRARHIPLTLSGAFFAVGCTVALVLTYFFPKHCESINTPLGFFYFFSFLPYPIRIIRLVRIFSLKGGINDPNSILNFLSLYSHWVDFQQRVHIQLTKHLNSMKRHKTPVECIYCLNSQPHTYSCTQQDLKKSLIPWSGLESTSSNGNQHLAASTMSQSMAGSTYGSGTGPENDQNGGSNGDQIDSNAAVPRSILDFSTATTRTNMGTQTQYQSGLQHSTVSGLGNASESKNSAMFSYGGGFLLTASPGQDNDNEAAIQRARDALQDPHSFQARQYMNLLSHNFKDEGDDDDDDDDDNYAGNLRSGLAGMSPDNSGFDWNPNQRQQQLGENSSRPQNQPQQQPENVPSSPSSRTHIKPTTTSPTTQHQSLANTRSNSTPKSTMGPQQQQPQSEQTVMRYLLRHQSLNEISSMSHTINETLTNPHTTLSLGSRPSNATNMDGSESPHGPHSHPHNSSPTTRHNHRHHQHQQNTPQLPASEVYEFTTCVECTCVSVFEASHNSLNNNIYSIYDYYCHNLHIEQDLAQAYDQMVQASRLGLNPQTKKKNKRQNKSGDGLSERLINDDLPPSDSTISSPSSSSSSSPSSSSTLAIYNDCPLHRFDTLESRSHFQVDSFFDIAPSLNGPQNPNNPSHTNPTTRNGDLNHHNDDSTNAIHSPNSPNSSSNNNTTLVFTSSAPLDQFHRCSARYIVRISLIVLVCLGFLFATANYLLSGLITPHDDVKETHYFCNPTTHIGGSVTIYSILAHGLHIVAFLIFLRLVSSVWSIYGSRSEFKIIIAVHAALLLLHVFITIFQSRLEHYNQRIFFWSLALRLTANIVALLVSPLTQVSKVRKPQLVQIDPDGNIIDKDVSSSTSNNSKSQNDQYTFDLLDVGFGGNNNQEQKLMEMRVPKQVTDIKIFDLIHRHIDSHLAVIALAIHRDFLHELHYIQEQQQQQQQRQQYQSQHQTIQTSNEHFAQFLHRLNTNNNNNNNANTQQMQHARMFLEHLLFGNIDQSVVRTVAANGSHLQVDLSLFYNIKPQPPPPFEVLITSSMGYSTLLSFLQHGYSATNAHVLLYCYVHVQSILLLAVNLLETMQYVLHLTQEHNAQLKEAFEFEQFSLDIDNTIGNNGNNNNGGDSGTAQKRQPRFIQPALTVELQQMLIYLLGCCESFASFYLENHSHSSQHPQSISIVGSKQTFSYSLLDCVLCVVTPHLSGSFRDVTHSIFTHLTALSTPQTLSLPPYYNQQNNPPINLNTTILLPSGGQDGTCGNALGSFSQPYGTLPPQHQQPSLFHSNSQHNNNNQQTQQPQLPQQQSIHQSCSMATSADFTGFGSFMQGLALGSQASQGSSLPQQSNIPQQQNQSSNTKPQFSSSGVKYEVDDMRTPQFQSLLSNNSKLTPIHLGSPIDAATQQQLQQQHQQSQNGNDVNHRGMPIDFGSTTSSSSINGSLYDNVISPSRALDIAQSSSPAIGQYNSHSSIPQSSQNHGSQKNQGTKSNSNRIPNSLQPQQQQWNSMASSPHLGEGFQRDFSMLLDKNNASSVMNRSFLIKKGQLPTATTGTATSTTTTFTNSNSHRRNNSISDQRDSTTSNSSNGAVVGSVSKGLPPPSSKFATTTQAASSRAHHSQTYHPSGSSGEEYDEEEDDDGTTFDANTGKVIGRNGDVYVPATALPFDNSTNSLRNQQQPNQSSFSTAKPINQTPAMTAATNNHGNYNNNMARNHNKQPQPQLPLDDFIHFYTQVHNLNQFQATTQLITNLYGLLKELERECTNAIAAHYSLFANSLHWKLLYYKVITTNHWCNILHICDLTEKLQL